MQGTGRYNIAQGAIATIQGIGAASSGLIVGLIVDHFGYTPAFLEAAGVALIALAVLAILMTETASQADRCHTQAGIPFALRSR
jgi:sugar phosphate permease